MNVPRIGSLFSGYSGLEMGVQAVLGGQAVWHSEIDPGACKILAHRYPDVPNLGDITAVDWSQVEPVDVLTGGFPCQDVSSAGKRAGLHSETRSGLWAQMVRAIDELRPPLIVAENVRGLLSACALSELEPCPRCLGDESQPHRPVLRALGRVLGDLSELGYDARWGGLRAADIGAPHARFRVFVVAWPAADTEGHGRDERRTEPARLERRPDAAIGGRAVAPHTADDGQQRPRRARDGRSGSEDHRDAASDASRGRDEDRPVGGASKGQHERAVAGSGAGDRAGGPASGVHELGRASAELAWGPYATAISRWEQLTRPAPAPTEIGAKGQPRLSPAFVEWMQGLPAGWVTDVPGLSRNEQLKALGNGVVPQQAAQALRMLLADVPAVAA